MSMDRIKEAMIDAVHKAMAIAVVDSMMESLDKAADDLATLKGIDKSNAEVVSVYALLIGTGMKSRGMSDSEIREALTDIVVDSGKAVCGIKERIEAKRKELIGTEDEYRIIDDEE